MNAPLTPARQSAEITFTGAVLLTLLAVFLFTGSHGFVKALQGGIHPFQIAFFTSLFSFTFYLPVLLRSKFQLMRTQQFPTHVARAFFNAGAVLSWYTALSLTPLADATALALTSPLFLTLGAILILGEPARARRWTALIIGAAGALVIIRPGFETVSIGFMFVILSAVLSSGGKLFAKHLVKRDPSVTCGAWVASLQMPITLAFAFSVWRWPDLVQLAMLASVGLLVGGAHFTMVTAYNGADVSALEPIHFSRLVIAAAIGFFIFSEFPDFWTWIGGAIIIASTTYIARRDMITKPPTGADGERPSIPASMVE